MIAEKPPAKPSSPPQASPGEARSRGARGKPMAKVKWLLALLAVGGALAAAVYYLVTNRPDLPSSGPSGPRYTLAMALNAFDAGAMQKAQRLAKLLLTLELSDQDAAGASFILGVIAAADAERLWDQDQRRYFRLAARYLEDARKEGYIEGREGLGTFLLGKSLLMSGNVEASRPVLEAAFEVFPQGQVEIRRLLALAYRDAPNRDLDRALEHAETYLADEALNSTERQQMMLARSQILFVMGRFDECEQGLAQIPTGGETGVEAIIVRGELMMRQASDAAKSEPASSATAMAKTSAKYREAIEILQQAQNKGTDRERITRRSMYLIGQCYLAMGDGAAARDQFRRTRLQFAESDEGIAAGIEEAKLTEDLGGDKELFDVYAAVLSAAGPADAYHNPLLPLAALQDRLVEAYQRFLASESFDRSVKLASMFGPLFGPDRALDLSAQARVAWAKQIELNASRSSGEEAATLRTTAEEQWHKAGDDFRQLAALRFETRSYPDDVWNGAESYIRGKHHAGAIELLQEYLRFETRRRRPRALTELGDALLSLNRSEQALVVLRECIQDFPQDAASYRARLLAAKAYAKENRFEEAKTTLLANLEGTQLTPDSVEWRDSLFALGILLHDEALSTATRARKAVSDGDAKSAEQLSKLSRDLYEETTVRLEEAVARYPDAVQLVVSRYLIGESYRELARFPREQLVQAKIETARIEHAKELQRLLLAALTEYEQVQDLLTRRREEVRLSPAENSILRNSYFARGAAFFELGRYDESIVAYSAATNRYQNEPEVLDAFLQIAACYRRLGKPDEARGVLEQAKVILSRIREDVSFSATTVHSRQEWNRVLDWMAAL